MALRDGDRSNFKTLLRAAAHGDLALMDCRRTGDGAQVAAVCAVYRDDAGMFNFVPLATMVEGNPYEAFEPPCPDDPADYGSMEGGSRDDA